MSEVAATARVAVLGAAASLVAATGCMRVDATEVHVRDPAAVGVVGDENNAWLLPPHDSGKPVVVYRNFALTATLARTASGGIDYTSEHWALGTRVDRTPLMGDAGHVGWASTPSGSQRFEEAVQHGGEVRLHPVQYVNETGPWGLCNGTLFDACIANPAVSMSLATDSRNIDEVRVTRTPLRGLGIAEIVLGAVSVGFGAVDGAVLLPDRSSDARNIALGVGAGLMVLGGLVIANGLWRLLTPEQTLVYRP